MLNAAAQHHVEGVRTLTARHLELLTGIARRAGVADPHLVGRQMLMLVEGATVVAEHHDTARAGEDAREAALTLLSAAAEPGFKTDARGAGEHT
ncbi:hypothetical protein AB0O34_15580 [Sphaerisporangium sp. NPDC088356]|uniref:hypothetical protein n=1 Tax=Sphaerisporangium sp. NPDC088356 TaxID=3154871 RepID=UPI0034308F38